MMGFGSYGGGSSNLSALAPPFTVDRSIPKPAATPLVDLGEPLNWVDSNPYTFNSPQPAQLPQMDLDAIPTPSYNQNSDLFEPKTFYSSYVSTSLHVPNFNEQSLSGLDHTPQWGGGSWDWEKGKPAQLGGSFYSEDTNVAPSTIYTDQNNLGARPPTSLKTCEETSQNIYSIGRENQIGPPRIEKLDYNPVLGQNHSFMPVDYSKTAVIGSSSTILETDLQVPSLNLVNCKNNQVSFSTSYEKPVRQHGTALSDSIPAMKSSPRIVIRPPAIDAFSSASNATSFKNFNTGINGTDTNLTGKNPFYVKEPHYLLNSGSKNDPSQVSFLLDGNCYLSGESSATKTEKLSTSNMAYKDASDHLFTEKSGITFSHICPNNFSLALDNNEPVIAVENSLESLDHYNPSVDSPCWRGAPYSYNSPFGSSEPVSVQPVKKLEACDGSNGQALKFIPMNTANVVKLPSGKTGEIRMTVENGNVEDGSISSLKLPSVSISSSREHRPDNAEKEGFYHKKASSAYEIKFSDDASELKKDYVLFNKKSVDEVEKVSCTIQQGLAKGRLASKNLRTSETAVADFEMKINDVSSCGSSHMSCHAVKNLSCSPSSEEVVSTKHSKFLGKEPVSNSSTRILVDTMHNLSELLLYHFSNETSELKEQDLKSLEKVVNNLNTCISKNFGQESFFSELHEGINIGRPQVAAIDVLSHHVQEKRKLSDKKDEKNSDFISVKRGTDIKVKNDKMTQAIKKVLVENFHEKEDSHPEVLLYKNLWLEAEAALCSINYMARFNNMKIEIEKCKLDSEKDLSEDGPDEDKISKPKFSAEVNTDKKLTAVAESEPTPAVSNQNSPIKSSSYHADDVTARFHVLKQRLNNSNSVHTGDVDELSRSRLSLDLDEIDKLATQVKDSSTLSLPSQDSPACHKDDVEASVMARLHILKSRGIDDVDSDEMESKLQPEVVDLGFAGSRKQIPVDKDTAEDGNSGVNLELFSQQQVANHAGEQLVVKDFHQCVQHDSTMQSPGSSRLGNQLSAGWYDSCSSDWEHVLKEELSGQNS